MSISEDKLAQIIKKQKDFGDLYSMVCGLTYSLDIIIITLANVQHIIMKSLCQLVRYYNIAFIQRLVITTIITLPRVLILLAWHCT